MSQKTNYNILGFQICNRLNLYYGFVIKKYLSFTLQMLMVKYKEMPIRRI